MHKIPEHLKERHALAMLFLNKDLSENAIDQICLSMAEIEETDGAKEAHARKIIPILQTFKTEEELLKRVREL